jgi:Domain of unknown function (DUF5618)
MNRVAVSKEEAYIESMRYIKNGKDTLKSAGKSDGYYIDVKYVRTACGTAYNGVLLALDYYLGSKGAIAPKYPKRKSIEWY